MGLWDRLTSWLRGEPSSSEPTDASPAKPDVAEAKVGPKPAAPRGVEAQAKATSTSKPKSKPKAQSPSSSTAVEAPSPEARRRRWAEVERHAVELERAGRAGEAAEHLRSSLKNLARHEPGALPCLCRRCLVPEQLDASASGASFFRDWAARDGRVLFYWAPTELDAERQRLRRSMRTSIGVRLRELRLAKRRAPKGGPRINPFTKLPMP